MAVENQPAPAQPVSPKLTMSRDFVQVIGAAAALAAVIIAGAFVIFSNLLIDMGYQFIDRRITAT